MRGDEPALFPVLPAFLSPIFFIIKLEPIKTLEETARTSPVTLSLDIPIYHKNIPTTCFDQTKKQLQGQDIQSNSFTLSY